MNEFNPEHFIQAVVFNLNKLRTSATDKQDGPETHAHALALVGNAFELMSEINTNLNRIAVAQEKQVELMTADMQEQFEGAVAEAAEQRVNQAMKEKEKRSFIGQKHD